MLEVLSIKSYVTGYRLFNSGDLLNTTETPESLEICHKSARTEGKFNSA